MTSDADDGSGLATSLFTPAFILLGLAELAYFTALGMTIPAIPLFAAGPLGASEVGVGLAVGAFSVTALVLRPWAGRASDRRGRRPLLLAGAALFSLVSLAHVAADGLAMLVGLRLLVGAAEAFFFVAAVAALADLAPPGRTAEAVSYNSLALYLGIAFGPLIGEVLIKEAGFDAAWIGVSALGVVTLLLAWRLPETRAITDGSDPRPPGRLRLFHPRAIGPGLGLFAGVAVMAGFLAFIAIHAIDVGLDGARLVLLVFGLTVIVVRVAFARISDRVAPMLLGMVALSLTGLGLVIAAVATVPIGLLVAAGVMGVGVAFLTPAMFSAVMTRVSPSERGAAMGTVSVFLDLAFGGGPIVFGLVAAQAGIPAAFVLGAVVALTGAAGAAVGVRRARSPSADRG